MLNNSLNLHYFNPFQPSVAFHTETLHLTCKAKQMTGFYMKCNELKWVKTRYDKSIQQTHNISF